MHEFTGNGSWQIVIVSTRNADAGATEVRDAIQPDFATEIGSGELKVHSCLRLALE